jgi:hypothetical protein
MADFHRTSREYVLKGAGNPIGSNKPLLCQSGEDDQPQALRWLADFFSSFHELVRWGTCLKIIPIFVIPHNKLEKKQLGMVEGSSRSRLTSI